MALEIDLNNVLTQVQEKWLKLRSSIRLSDHDAAGETPQGYWKWLKVAAVAFFCGGVIEFIAPGVHDYDYLTQPQGTKVSHVFSYALLGLVTVTMAYWASVKGNLIAAAPERLTKQQLLVHCGAALREESLCRLLLIPLAVLGYRLLYGITDYFWYALPTGAFLAFLAPFLYSASWITLSAEKAQHRRRLAKYCAVASASVAGLYLFIDEELPHLFDQLIIPVADGIASAITLGDSGQVLLAGSQEPEFVAAALTTSMFSADTAKYKRGSAQYWMSKLVLAPVWVGILVNAGFVMTLLVRGLYEVCFVVILWILRLIRDDKIDLSFLDRIKKLRISVGAKTDVTNDHPDPPESESGI